MWPNYDPLKDPNVEYMMKMQQLNMIAQALEALYPDEPTVQNMVKQGKQLLLSSSINEGADILQKILYSPNASEEKKSKHEEIVQQAKKFAENSYEMLRAGQIPEFMVGYGGPPRQF